VVTYAALGGSEEEYAASTLDVVFPKSRRERGRGHEHPALPEPRPLLARCAVRAFDPLGGGMTRARLEITLQNDDGSRTTVTLSGRVLSREVLERARAAHEAVASASPPAATPEPEPVTLPPADPADVEAAPDSVLVSAPTRDGDALTFTFFTQAAPLWLADVGLDHVPAVLLIEAATQALLGAARAAEPSAPAPPRIACFERLEARLFRFLRPDVPASLRVQLSAPEEPESPPREVGAVGAMGAMRAMRAMRAVIEVAQHGRPPAMLTLAAALTDPS